LKLLSKTADTGKVTQDIRKKGIIVEIDNSASCASSSVGAVYTDFKSFAGSVQQSVSASSNS